MATDAGRALAMSIPGLLARQATRDPGAPCLLTPGEPPLDYAGLWEVVGSISGALRAHSIGAADRVAIVLPNGRAMAAAFLGVSAAAVAAPLNPACRESEFEFYLSDLRARAVVAQAGAHACRDAARAMGLPIIDWDGLRDHPGAAAVECHPMREALVLHTSGTTSRPKLVPLTHANLCHSAANVATTLALEPRDRCLNVMPLFHIHGLVAALLASLSAGASVVATPGFDAARFFGWIDEFRPTWYTAVPTIHQAVLGALSAGQAPPMTRSLRVIRSSSAALPPAVMAELEAAFRVPVLEAYGMTEAAHQMASNPLPPRVRKPGSVGPAAGPDVGVMDETGRLLDANSEGEVVIRGPNVTAGYENDSAANTTAFSGGWFRTGDLGYVDPDGYLYLTGRLKEIINRGGEKIAPKEIDHCLMEHPAVLQAVTFAVPHTSLGQDVAAAVVLRHGATATPAELRRFVASRAAAFKVPARIVMVAEIPKGPTGKLQRIGLAEQLGLLGRRADAAGDDSAYTPPRTETETRLAGIWARVLGVQRVGVHDAFAQLGGDSLQAAVLLTDIGVSFGVDPDSLSFDASTTVAELAARLTSDVE
jgi:acyl-CoA synthetase (AMP-forming)/AMP-acid ligase II